MLLTIARSDRRCGRPDVYFVRFPCPLCSYCSMVNVGKASLVGVEPRNKIDRLSYSLFVGENSLGEGL